MYTYIYIYIYYLCTYVNTTTWSATLTQNVSRLAPTGWPKVRERQVDAAQILPETLRGQNPGSRGTPWTLDRAPSNGRRAPKVQNAEAALEGLMRMCPGRKNTDFLHDGRSHRGETSSSIFQSHFKYSDFLGGYQRRKNMKKHEISKTSRLAMCVIEGRW